MKLNEYQQEAYSLAYYGAGSKIIYPTLGLCGESGEVAEKVKKFLRDDLAVMSDETRFEIKKELGDVLWYVSALANDLGFTLEDVAETNLKKLHSRHARGTLSGSGDNR